MKNQYQTRKEQINKEFAPRLLRELKKNSSQRKAVQSALRDAAMIGAAEERHRTLKLISDEQLRLQIVALPVLAVLGYDR